jgi:hypothetical protein
MPLLHGIYLDQAFNEKYIILSINDGWVKVVWTPKNHDHGMPTLFSNATFPIGAMIGDIYCGQATELVLSLI